jgi:hypothetical protein
MEQLFKELEKFCKDKKLGWNLFLDPTDYKYVLDFYNNKEAYLFQVVGDSIPEVISNGINKCKK